MSISDYRAFLPDRDEDRLRELRGLDARSYAEYAKTDPFTGPMIEGWAELYPEPFTGVTCDGVVRPGVYEVGPVRPDRRAPVADMVKAARRLLDGLDPEPRSKVQYDLGAHEWRTWANPEFMQHDTGLRLDDLDAETIEQCLEVVRASLSPEGYALVRDLMQVNAVMGDLVDLPVILGEYSYHFSMFGEPDEIAPWGWSLFGHHIALNCLVVDGRLVVSPVFLGAEPSTVDTGPLDGSELFVERIATARRLMGALSTEQIAAVRTFERVVDPSMPEGRVHSGDERHLAGAFQDNRVIPYEGLAYSALPPIAQEAMLELVDQFHEFWPEGPRAVRRDEILGHLDDTWFSWIGGFGPSEPFYFRIQSPVVILELDHHCGVFLTNDEPMHFHIHTVMRMPNGNDYGRLLAAAQLPAGSALPGDVV